MTPQSDEINCQDPAILRIRLRARRPVRQASQVPRPSARQSPDDVSKAIIAQLQEDGRRPYATIGKAVGLSEAAVRQRVQKLVDTDVMQIVAVTDPMQIGFDRQAMVAIVGDRRPRKDRRRAGRRSPRSSTS